MSSRRLVLALAVAAATASPTLADHSEFQNRLEGTWDVVLTFSDGSEVRSVLTVIPGTGPHGGSIVHSAAASFSPPNPTLPEQGSWKRTGHRRFVASYHGFSYDTSFNPFGRVGFRHAIVLSQNGRQFAGRAVFEVIEGDTVVFSDTVQSRGVRQTAVGP
jgi:hypothetical protein